MSNSDGHDPNPAHPSPTGDPTSPSKIPPKTPGGKEEDGSGEEFPTGEVAPKAESAEAGLDSTGEHGGIDTFESALPSRVGLCASAPSR
jgi:hypothetical protein